MENFFENLLSNGELQAEIAELKAENERIKRENEIITGMHNSSSNRFDKLYNTLQEIKAIVCSNYEIIDPQGRKDILKLINKTEIK